MNEPIQGALFISFKMGFTFVLAHTARGPHHSTAGSLRVCRDGEVVHHGLQPHRKLARIFVHMRPIQETLRHKNKVNPIHLFEMEKRSSENVPQHGSFYKRKSQDLMN